MRAIALTCTLLFIQPSLAGLKVRADFSKESQILMSKAEKETDKNKRVLLLEKLKASLEKTLDQYEKENPDSGGEKEKEISRFLYTLDPAFDLASEKKKDETRCEQAAQAVRSSNNLGKQEGTELTADAKETLRWIELLCK
ncbi:hypothetical protein [Bdellovibrio bacteriovorus]|uniref:hypothetical protein n=1 Tax=Bdellovibrio bacteriovorus TaxID=959 RepID=UPI0035A68B8A